ncbi:hypothetical protein FOA52_010746 [Chlamydomonas sp. UWO 241]|nr:hypothetical protein FOA52_010746 [Chlamydomonas sp. UWO 241]
MQQDADRNEEMGRALREAACKGDVAAMRMVLDHPSAAAVLMSTSGIGGFTALMLAAAKGNVAAMHTLIDHPAADVAAMLLFTGIGGLTAFTLCVSGGHVEAMRMLLDHPSADPGAMMMHRDDEGQTALMLAAWRGDFEAMRLLLKRPSSDSVAMLAFDSAANYSALVAAAISELYCGYGPGVGGVPKRPFAPLLLLLRRVAVHPSQPSDDQVAHMSRVVVELCWVVEEEGTGLFDDDQPDDAGGECVRLLLELGAQCGVCANTPVVSRIIRECEVLRATLDELEAVETLAQEQARALITPWALALVALLACLVFFCMRTLKLQLQPKVSQAVPGELIDAVMEGDGGSGEQGALLCCGADVNEANEAQAAADAAASQIMQAQAQAMQAQAAADAAAAQRDAAATQRMQAQAQAMQAQAAADAAATQRMQAQAQAAADAVAAQRMQAQAQAAAQCSKATLCPVGPGELIAVARMGFEKEVSWLLSRGAHVNEVDSYGLTSLCRAAYDGCAGVAYLLLNHNAWLDKADKYGHTPLWWAAFNGHAGVVSLLLERSASVDQADNTQAAEKQAAQQQAQLQQLAGAMQRMQAQAAADAAATQRMQAQAAADAAAAQRMQAQTAADAATAQRSKAVLRPVKPGELFAAASEGFKEKVGLLLIRGADVNEVVENGRTPLYWAAYRGNTRVVSLLLEYNALMDQSDNCGRTPLSIARS